MYDTRFEVFMVMVMEVMVFWEDGGSKVLHNVGTHPPHNMVQQPRKP
jgi:hypothetical protein